MVLETNIWVWDVHTTSGVSQPPVPLSTPLSLLAEFLGMHWDLLFRTVCILARLSSAVSHCRLSLKAPCEAALAQVPCLALYFLLVLCLQVGQKCRRVFPGFTVEELGVSIFFSFFFFLH